MEVPINKFIKAMAVDDNHLMLIQLEMLLKSVGINKLQCWTGGEDALKDLAKGNCYDLIFIDLQMPNIDGIELLEALAQLEVTSSIILLSGVEPKIMTTATNLAKAHKLNILASTNKPISQEKLANIINLHFSQERQKKSHANKEVGLVDLKNAIKNGDIVPYYQPKVITKSEKICSVEVLARWCHAKKGVISPEEFIQLAEDNELISELTFRLIEKVALDVHRWAHYNIRLDISLNISAHSLNEDSFISLFDDLVSYHQLPKNILTLEVTETALMKNINYCIGTLIRLRMKGYILSIDDFGTGYSSLSQLDKAPFSELKIDRSFIDGCSSDDRKQAIVESTVLLANKLEMTTVAEGVEHYDDLALLSKLNVDYIQGYYFAKPMSGEDIIRFLHDNTSKFQENIL